MAWRGAGATPRGGTVSPGWRVLLGAFSLVVHLWAPPPGGAQVPPPDPEIDRLRTHLAQSPDDLSSRLDLARRLSWVKRYDESLQEYRRLLTLRPQDRTVRWETAQVMSWAGYFPEALTELDLLLKSSPPDTEVSHLRAKVLSWAGRYDEAIAAYRSLLTATRGRRDIRADLADVLLWAERYPEAQEEIERILREEPTSGRAHLQRARLLVGQERFDDALALYRQILDREPGNREARLGEAEVWRARGKILRAEALLTRIAREDPPSPDPHLRLAELYRDEEVWGAAWWQYAEARSRDPGSAEARRGRDEIARRTRPVLLGQYGFFRNSDDFKRQTVRGEATLFLHPALPVTVGSAHWWYRQGKRGVEATSADLSVALPASLRMIPRGGIGGTAFTNGKRTLTGFIDLGIQPTDATTVSLGYSRVDVFSGPPGEVLGLFDESSLTAVEQTIQADDLRIRGTQALTEDLSGSLEGHYSHYVDEGGNDKVSLSADLLYRLLRQPTLRAGYRFFYLSFSHASSSYFSPQEYISHGAVLEWEQTLGRNLTYSVTNVLFYQPKSSEVGDSVEAAVTYTLTGSLRLRGTFGFTASDLGGEGFHSIHLVTGLTYSF